MSKVREAIGSASLDVKPFSPKEQWSTGEPGESEVEDAVVEQTVGDQAPLPKARPKKKLAPAKATHKSDYCADEFNKVFKAFMLQAKESGLKRPEALEQWKLDPERLRLLEGMPLPEQKRRRFVPCGKAA